MTLRVPFALVLVVAGAVHAAAQGLPGAVGEEANVGSTISGVPCRLRLVNVANENETYRIFCEGWDQPVARVFREPRRRWTAEGLQKESRWITALLERTANCAEPQAKRVLGDIEGSVRSCTTQEGGWPYLALAAAPEKLIVGADGPPDALPAIENAIALMAGRQAASSGRSGQGLSEYNLRLYESLVGGAGRPPTIAANQQFDALRRLGLEYNYARDFSGAEQVYARALAMHEATFGVDHPGAADTISNLALNVARQGRNAEADRLFARADTLLKATRDPSDTRRYLAYRAFIESQRGNTAEAKRFAEDSLKIATQAQGQVARAGRGSRLAHSQVAVMTVYARLGDHAQAEKVAREALENFQSEYGRYHSWTSRMATSIAVSQLRQGGRLTDAEKFARDGAQIAELLYGDGLMAIEANLRLGEVLIAARKTEEGLAAMRKAKAMALANRKARAGLRAGQVEPYVEALLAAAKGNPANAAAFFDEAFQALQVPVDHVVARAMTQMSARLASSDSGVREAARQLQDAQDEVDRLRQRLAGLADREKRDAGQEQALAGRIEAAMQRRDGLERQLQAANPRYAALTGAAPLALAQLQQALRPGEALLSVTQLDAGAHVTIIGEGRVQIVRSALTADEARLLVDRVRASVDWANRGQQAFDFAAASELSAKLLGPIDAQLAGIRTLKVVADGPLASLPFALLLRRPGGNDPASAAWLLRDMAVSVLPSVAALAELRQVAGASRARQSFLGFGAPAFTGGEAAMTSRANTQCRDGKVDRDLVRALAPLPETAKELDGIARFLKAPKTSIVLGQQATKTNMQSKNLADFRVVAFATHGLLSGDLPCQNEPALALTPPAKAGEDTGILAASDIARLRLDADWVLLSACNTAGPDGARGGQALSGLVRAFLYAGSRAVLASHWAVASEPTVQLTTQTLKAFGEGGAGRAEALRQAQLAMLQNPATAHPVFWAPFVVVGEGGR